MVDIKQRKKFYKKVPNKPTDYFGKCPVCNTSQNKIIWGWGGVYYDMLCENGHDWKYNFPKSQGVLEKC